MSLQRFMSKKITVALNTAEGTTEAFNYGSFSGGSITIPHGSSITSLAFWGAVEEGGTYEAIYTGVNAAAGAAVTRTVAANRCYALPDECFGFAAIKIVVNTAESIDICLKG